jgi:hypothetical protein
MVMASSGCVSVVDSNGRTIWIADAHRGDGKRFRLREIRPWLPAPDVNTFLRRDFTITFCFSFAKAVLRSFERDPAKKRQAATTDSGKAEQVLGGNRQAAL